MPMFVCHGPKGGAGNTFAAAHLAMGLAEAGAEVTVLTMAARDTMGLHFGLAPSVVLPAMSAPVEDSVVAGGIELRSDVSAPSDPDFIPMLRELGYLDAGKERVIVLDVPSGDWMFARRILPHAAAQLCSLTAQPDTLSLLPQVLDEMDAVHSRTAFIINRLDETRRLSRHDAAFLRELLGPRLVGRVRHDEAVVEAIAMLQPLARYAPASAALADMVAVCEAMVPALDNGADRWISPVALSRAA